MVISPKSGAGSTALQPKGQDVTPAGGGRLLPAMTTMRAGQRTDVRLLLTCDANRDTVGDDHKGS